MSVYGRGQYSNGHDHNYFLHRNAKGTARPNDLIVTCGLHFAHFQFQVSQMNKPLKTNQWFLIERIQKRAEKRYKLSLYAT